MPTLFPSSLKGRWNAWKGDANHQGFVWDESILDMVCGDAIQFLTSLEKKECIYMSIFLEAKKHWVILEVNLDLWKLFVFDFSIGSITPNYLKKLMEDFFGIFTSFLDQSRIFNTHYMIMVP
uniref:Ubiquitin-like protease family profile domain-containing protein n=1 Tax=Cannabis sativa TaxID=3483 RepID=A0A803Q0A3_CANSA